MTEIKITAVAHENKQRFKTLYQIAFPKCERKPYYLMKYWQLMGKMQLFQITDNGQFCGLLITVVGEEIILIDYLAVCPDYRGRGIGSAALSVAREMYEGKRIILEIESTLAPCSNMTERLQRKNFYLKNGLKLCGFSVNLFGVDMEILTLNEAVTFEEYMELYRRMAGRLLKLKIKLL